MFESRAAGSEGDSSPVCLAFTNTLRWHASAEPQETLLSYPDLVTWAEAVGLLSGRQARRLGRAAANDPAQAGRVLKRAVALREAIYRILLALIHKKSPAETDLAELNGCLSKVTRGGLVRTAAGLVWEWDVDRAALDSLVGLIGLSAAGLLTSEERRRVGQCADDRGCGWLFLDTSRNRSRRWCDINDCGNRAKQRRHYQRVRRRSVAA